MTDPLDPAGSGIAHLPRPVHAYFDHEGSSVLYDIARIFIGTQGRGVWQIDRTVRRNFFRLRERMQVACSPVRMFRNTLVLTCDRLPCFFQDSQFNAQGRVASSGP